jgi:hypothetical protein
MHDGGYDLVHVLLAQASDEAEIQQGKVAFVPGEKQERAQRECYWCAELQD